MRIVFAGTPEFAVPSLEALVASNREIVLVLTRPDRPAGRGLSVQESAVKRAATRNGLSVFQPATLRDPAAVEVLREHAPDLMVVAAYGLILPQAALDVPPRGAINVHASLLPRWRGAAPIQRALLAGDAETGVSIMRMEAGLDTGPVLMSEPLAIEPEETAGTLHDKLAAVGARLLAEALDRLEQGTLHPVRQPESGVTYAAKIEKSEAWINWSRAAESLARQVRAFDPFPGALARLRGVDVKIWRVAQCAAASGGPPGVVLAASRDGIVVACGTGALRLLELQRAGARRLAAGAFLSGTPVAPGDRFEGRPEGGAEPG